jgi:hypothetical protein
MPENWGWVGKPLVAGASCPMPACGTITISYKSVACPDGEARTNFLGWEFACPRCGTEFVPSRDELIFQSVPKNWLLASISHA